MKKTIICLTVILLFAGTGVDLFAQRNEASPTLKKEIIKVNYVNAREALSILQVYCSRHGRIQLQRNRNMLIIEDQPEFVDKLLSILKDIDMKPLDLQFTVDLILASSKQDFSDKKIASDPVIKEIKKMLKYEYFKHLDSSLIKVLDNSHSSQRMGGDGISLQLILEPRHIKEGEKDSFQVELSLRQNHGFRKDGSDNTYSLIDTTLMLKSGERSIVGVSKLNGGDKALIMILKGTILK